MNLPSLKQEQKSLHAAWDWVGSRNLYSFKEEVFDTG